MTDELIVTKMGKLRIYMAVEEVIKSKTLLRKMFPQNKYLKIMQEAKTMGILNAHAFHTHAAMRNGGKMGRRSTEGDSVGLTVCIELVDAKNKLQQFFETHRDILAGNTVIYKEVEYWQYQNQS